MLDKKKVVLTLSVLVITGGFLIGVPRFDGPLAMFGFLFLSLGLWYMYKMLPTNFVASTAFSQCKPSTGKFTLPNVR